MQRQTSWPKYLIRSLKKTVTMYRPSDHSLTDGPHSLDELNFLNFVQTTYRDILSNIRKNIHCNFHVWTTRINYSSIWASVGQLAGNIIKSIKQTKWASSFTFLLKLSPAYVFNPHFCNFLLYSFSFQHLKQCFGNTWSIIPTKSTELNRESECESDQGGTTEKRREAGWNRQSPPLPPHHPVGVVT